MKITDLKCTVIGESPIVRITTDQGIDGLGQGERTKSYLNPQVLFYKEFILDSLVKSHGCHGRGYWK